MLKCSTICCFILRLYQQICQTKNTANLHYTQIANNVWNRLNVCHSDKTDTKGCTAAAEVKKKKQLLGFLITSWHLVPGYSSIKTWDTVLTLLLSLTSAAKFNTTFWNSKNIHNQQLATVACKGNLGQVQWRANGFNPFEWYGDKLLKLEIHWILTFSTCGRQVISRRFCNVVIYYISKENPFLKIIDTYSISHFQYIMVPQ